MLDSEKDSGNESLTRSFKKSYRYTSVRWLLLAFACLNLLGNYYGYDNPSALQSQLTQKLKLTNFQFNLLYSVYSFPNMILPLFGGSIVDYMGVRAGILIFSFILLLGQLMFAFGTSQESFILMIIGRVIYGLGGECLTVSQNALISNWFIGKELAFALGINISIARAGSSLNSWLSPFVAQKSSVSTSLYVSVIVLAIAFVGAIFIVILDKRKDVQEGNTDRAKLDPTELVKFAQIKNFSGHYWLLVAICVLVYVSFFPFLNVANDFVSTRFGFTNEVSGSLLMIIYLTSACSTPFLGIIVDRFGKRVKLMLFSYMFLFIGHGLFAFLPNSATPNYIVVFPLACLGIFYSLFVSVLWPSFPLVCDLKTLGTAFGLATAIQNIGLTTIPLLVGHFHDITEETDGKFGYYSVSLFLLYVSALGCIYTIGLLIHDKWNKSILDKVQKGRKSSIARKSFMM